MAKKRQKPDTTFLTPLKLHAVQAHELYTEYKEAGFTEGEAWELLMRQLPDLELEALDFLEEGLDDVDEE
jgi:hypothetical protein